MYSPPPPKRRENGGKGVQEGAVVWVAAFLDWRISVWMAVAKRSLGPVQNDLPQKQRWWRMSTCARNDPHVPPPTEMWTLIMILHRKGGHDMALDVLLVRWLAIKLVSLLNATVAAAAAEQTRMPSSKRRAHAPKRACQA